MLTEVLRAMRLSGAVFLDAEFTEPWCISSKVGPDDCRPFMAPPAHLIAYHHVVEGRLLLSVEGETPLAATAGHLVVLPRNDAHVLGSDLNVAPASADDLIEPPGEDGLARIRFGGGGPRTRILCGFLGSDECNAPLLSALPSVLNLDLKDTLAGPWIEGSMRYAARELASGGDGAPASLALLAELLLAEAIREYAKAQPPDRKGWLSGIRDPHVGRALALIHGRPTHPWTLEDLSREVGLSRSVLTDRFARFIGISPMRYLQRRRLDLAAAKLRNGRQSIARVAYESGYDSEAAFSRAFKRERATSPGAYRKAENET